jgi:hypothetical protein
VGGEKMSIEYRAVVVVGLTFEEVDFDLEIAEDKGLELFSLYYDAPIEDCLVGIPVVQTSSYNYKSFDPSDLQTNIEAAKVEFNKLTGLNARVFLTTYGM